LDAVPVACSDSYVIINYEYLTEAQKINENYQNFEKILKKYLNLDYNIVAISTDEWKKAKEQYVAKINSKEKFEMIKDKFCEEINSFENKKEEIIYEKDNLNDIETIVSELFDSKDIEIK